jgi:hypothetical protein
MPFDTKCNVLKMKIKRAAIAVSFFLLNKIAFEQNAMPLHLYNTK